MRLHHCQQAQALAPGFQPQPFHQRRLDQTAAKAGFQQMFVVDRHGLQRQNNFGQQRLRVAGQR